MTCSAGCFDITLEADHTGWPIKAIQRTLFIESICTRGDVNCDGSITPGDALMAFLLYLMIVNPDDYPACDIECAGDWDSSGQVTPQDALCIFKEYLNSPCQ